MLRNGAVSHWFPQLPDPRPALPGDRDADVCIVGAGYTGLWTAYYLKQLDPALRITVLEARFAGF
ncbi:MAG: FAD-dependent oxidoreductase, partial [Mycobacterium sp.]|nr:FAD-dependent oxidoreductase [Mycobacterium sp.]